jgi:hypothetical protein
LDIAAAIPYASRMDPETALDCQVAAYRRMTGQERLAIALDLHTFACNLARAGIRAQFPDASEEEVERKLRERLVVGRQLASSSTSIG